MICNVYYIWSKITTIHIYIYNCIYNYYILSISISIYIYIHISISIYIYINLHISIYYVYVYCIYTYRYFNRWNSCDELDGIPAKTWQGRFLLDMSQIFGSNLGMNGSNGMLLLIDECWYLKVGCWNLMMCFGSDCIVLGWSFMYVLLAWLNSRMD